MYDGFVDPDVGLGIVGVDAVDEASTSRVT
jgi:hypothetical protein